MLVSKDGTTTYSSTPARELAKVEARLLKLLPATGTPSEATAAEIGRLSRLHDVWRAEADKETVARWEFHQRGLAVHRRIAAEHQDALKKLGREYPAAVQREQKRWDEAHAKELAAEPSTNGHHADDVALPEV